MALAVIIGFYLVYFLKEVYHDNIHRLINNKALNLVRMLRKATGQDLEKDKDQFMEWNRQWHRLDWLAHAWLSLLPGFWLSGLPGPVIWWKAALVIFTTSLMIGAERVLVLNLWGNQVAGVKWNYLSSSGFESNFEGKNTVYYLLVLLLFLGSIYVLKTML